MAQAKQGDKVKIHYTGKLNDGSIFDSSLGSEPLEFTIGAGEVIPGFDQAALGMAPSEKKTVTIPADEAYGQHSEEMVVPIDRAQLPPDMNPEIGMELYMQQPGAPPMPVVIVDMDDTSITIDANHPLAGHDLTFDIEMVSIDGPPSLIITP